MKRFFETIGVIICTLFIILIIFSVCSFFSTYERQAIVTEVHDDEIVCMDRQRQEWVFLGDGFEKGEEIVLIMKDNETVGIKDDIIVKVKKVKD